MSKSKTASPTPAKVQKEERSEVMDFYAAVKQAENGEHIARITWDSEFYCFLEGTLKIHNADGKVHDWVISQQDIISKDWVIV